MRALICLPICLSIALASPTPLMAEDLDGDEIDDAFEQRLLDLYAPYIRIDVWRTGPESGVGIPSSIPRLIQHASINRYIEDQIVFLYQPTSVQDAIHFLKNYPNGGSDLSLRHRHDDYMWGYSDLPGGVSDWPTAISQNDGLFGRVWRPWVGLGYADIYSVQYFVYLTYNDIDDPDDEGSHEGDWVAVDIAVDARANPQYPTILHMVLHNHGRQFFVEPRCIEFFEGHPVVYLENEVNEAWPNAGTGTSWIGGNNWPSRDGFASNKNLDFEGSSFVNESTGRDHTGEGNLWPTWHLPVKNIGDNGHSLCGEEGEFILLYSGRYGDRSEGDFYEGDPPRGPPFQVKMWNRDWLENRHDQVLGPWAAVTNLIPNDSPDPFDFPLSICAINSPSYSFCLWSSSGYTFELPSRPALGEGLPFWVLPGGADRIEGTRDRPYNSFETAVSRVPPGSEIYMLGSDPDFRGTISKPITIHAEADAVMIGQ